MSPRSRRSGGLRPPSSGPARPEHRPAATSRRSLQACIASLPLQSSLMSDTYLKSDHFNGGGSPTCGSRWEQPTTFPACIDLFDLSRVGTSVLPFGHGKPQIVHIVLGSSEALNPP